MTPPMSRLGAVARDLRWFIRDLMGDSAYETYSRHQRATHPGATWLSEREFWIERYRDQDRSPGSRCC